MVHLGPCVEVTRSSNLRIKTDIHLGFKNAPWRDFSTRKNHRTWMHDS